MSRRRGKPPPQKRPRGPVKGPLSLCGYAPRCSRGVRWSRSSRTVKTPTLIGRSAETAVINRLLDHAREGHSGVLVLRGEAGCGKSALLEHAAIHADGFTVLHGVG